jgi:hypothetical protein
MRDFGRMTRLFGLVCLLTLTIASVARSQTVGASPTDLSFGVPTVNPTPTGPVVSAPQNLTVNLTGSTAIMFTSISSQNSATPPPTTDKPTDFVVTSNTCTGSIDPTTTNYCQLTVTFTASQAPSTTLETASLVIVTSAGTLTVPMNGAYGAIELFGALDTNPSLFSGVTWPNSPGNAVKSTTLTLSCPSSGVTGFLSSTPDGSANLFQDNTIQIINAPMNQAPVTTSNVCYGGDTNFQGYPNFPTNSSNCFQSSYESAAGGLLGNNPDLPINSGSSIAKTYGVSPVNLQLAQIVLTPGTPPVSVYSAVLQPGMQSLTVQLVDAGGDLGASTVQLVTNCSPAGVTSGGSITGNPVTSNPSSQTQTFTFDNAPGQNISITSSNANSGVANTTGVVPVVTDFGISQSQFNELVAGTSAAPAVCLRLAGELDSSGNALCKGYLIQCYNPNDGTTTGDNCVTNADQARTLFDFAKFSSPDAPVNGTNFLTAKSCNFFLDGAAGGTGACAQSQPGQLIGAGMLLGSDNWLTISDGSYSVANCNFGSTGTLKNNLCPLDTLTQFKGASDSGLGSTTTGRNSIFVPVANMPLPYTATTVGGQNSNGWTKSMTPTATFVSNPATYPAAGTSGIPSRNNFAPAAIYSLTFGTSPAGSPIPDTTYPISTDTTNLNAIATNGTFGPPACTNPVPTGPNNGAFTSTTTPTATTLNPSTFSSLLDGVYNLHYFATDCAFTEELLFNPTGSQLTDPNANWASFEVVSFGLDRLAPELTSACTLSSSAQIYNGTTVWYSGPVTQTCDWNDPQSGSGFASGFANDGYGHLPTQTPNAPTVLQGSLTTVTTSTATPSGQVAQQFTIGPQSVQDLAGNTASAAAVTVNIDTQPPTDSISGGGTFTVGGSSATITYSCNDYAGSGIANCSASGFPSSGVTQLPCTQTTELWTCSATIAPGTGNVGKYSVTVAATDNVGNVASAVSTSVSIVYSTAAASVLFAELPTLAIPGQKLQVFIAAADFSPAKTPTVVYGAVANITLTLPSGTLATGGAATAMYGTVNCTSWPCTDTPSSGPACTVSTTAGSSTTINVSCPLGTINDAYTTRTGDMIIITLPISSKATFGKTITTSGKLTAASPINGTTSFNTPILIF